MSRTTISLAALLATGVIWGLQVPMLKLAVNGGANEINVMVIALALISLVYAVILAVRGELFVPTRRITVFLTIIAILGYLLPMAATLYAAPHVSAGLMVLLISLSPICTFAAAFLFRSEKLSTIRIGAMLIGCIAAAMVLVPSIEPGSILSPLWLCVVLVVPLCYGVESVYIDIAWPDGLSVFQVGMGEAVAATILTLPLLFLFGDPANLALSLDTTTLAIVVFAVAGLFDVFLYFYLIRTTGGVLVSFATFISLFAGIGWGRVIFDEQIGATGWMAVGVLVLALALVTLDTWRRGKGDCAPPRPNPAP